LDWKDFIFIFFGGNLMGNLQGQLTMLEGQLQQLKNKQVLNEDASTQMMIESLQSQIQSIKERIRNGEQ
jgi:capsule polysaccharide export protein KpsE/RkpR